MKNEALNRILEGLKLARVEKGERNKVVAEKTGYSVKTIGNILSGAAALTPRFIQAVCSAFGISRAWVEMGDSFSGWRERVATKFHEETGELASSEDIEAGNIRHQDQNFAKLLRLHSALTEKSISEHGRIAAVSAATGFSEAEIAGILTGDAAFHLTDAFLQAVCAKFGINKAWIELGDDMPVAAGDYRKTMDAYTRRDPCAGSDSMLPAEKMVPLDAPTQEIMNDMKKLTEANRWVFVGKVKPVIQALIDEQGNDRPTGP